jgi:enamine deaminase RidA (YjgF/YER057c/UK114 family)
MSRRLISTGSPFEALAGYSRAVVEGDMCFVAGTTGYDYASMTMPDDVGAQAKNALATIERALSEGGFARADIVRATYYVTEIADAEVLLPIFGEFFRDVHPATTLLAVAALYRAEMKVEIEVTAKRRS